MVWSALLTNPASLWQRSCASGRLTTQLLQSRRIPTDGVLILFSKSNSGGFRCLYPKPSVSPHYSDLLTPLSLPFIMLAKLIVIAGAAVCTVVVSALPTMAQRDGFKPIYSPLRASVSRPPFLVRKSLIAGLPLNTRTG